MRNPFERVVVAIDIVFRTPFDTQLTMQCCWDQACTALSHGTRLHALVVALVNGVDQSWTPERHVKAYSEWPGVSRNKRVSSRRRRIPQNDGGNTQQTLCSPRFPQDLDLFRPAVPVRTSAAL
jgi:hypothetical protein